MFCFALSGDVVANRKLAEAVLVGCIPVFIRAPFHARQFPQYVNESQLGPFDDVAERPWILTDADRTWVNATEKVGPAVDTGSLIRVQSLGDLVVHLERTPQRVIEAYQVYGTFVRKAFTFTNDPNYIAGANHAITKDMCSIARGL